MPGAALLTATTAELKAAKIVLAKSHMVSSTKPFACLLGHGLQDKVRWYRQLSRVKRMLADGREVFANLSQHPLTWPSFGTCMPCLLTGSQVYALKANRPVLATELLEASGVPLLDHRAQLLGLPGIPIKFSKLSLAVLKRFAGNGFHLACAGHMFGYLVCCVSPSKKRASSKQLRSSLHSKCTPRLKRKRLALLASLGA